MSPVAGHATRDIVLWKNDGFEPPTSGEWVG